jgi:dimethylamine monooxygenase subunit A
MESNAIHTPYDGSSKPFTIGLKALDVREWLDRDQHFETYIAEKRRLYIEETANVLVAETGTDDAQQEVLDMVVGHLATYFPTLPRHPGEGRGPALVEALGLDLKLDPGLRRDDVDRGRDDHIVGGALATAALMVQEDLVLMRHSPNGWRLVAASLCFPSAWNLHEKFGRPLHEIHQPVPGFGEGTRNAGLIDRMFDNLRVEQPVIRWNWSLYGDAKLYHPASDNKMKNRFGEGKIDGRVIMRLERQTLRKLPKSGDILFTIRIYNNPIEVLKNHAAGAELAQAIMAQLSAMTPEQLDYKGLLDEVPKLMFRLGELAQR